MNLRSATHDDLTPLLALEQACFGHAAYPPFPLRQFIDLCPQSFLVAEDDTGVCGYTFGALVSDRARVDAWLLALAVSERARGRGLGRQLSLRLVEILDGLGASRIRLTTELDNAVAIQLYTGLGFREIERAEDYFGPGEPRVVMERLSR